MTLCILAAGKLTVIAASAFTLSWSQSVERTAWQEEWRVTGQGLALVSARIEGSGAGMEPPPDAVFDGSGWRYDPDLPVQPRLVLAESGAAGEWHLCALGQCRTLEGRPTEPIVLKACP